MADTATSTLPADDCLLVGAITAATDSCKAIRVAFRTEVADCMDQMHADAEARTGQAQMSTLQTSRSRFLICNAAVRAKMDVAAD